MTAHLNPPDHYDDERRTIWAETIARLTAAGRAFRADPEILGTYVEAVRSHRQASRLLAETNVLVVRDGHARENPALAVQRRTAQDMARASKALGLDHLPTSGSQSMTTADSSPAHDGKCGGKKKQGEGNCTQAAGWGTDHVGAGRCKLHGGSTPNGRKAGAMALAEQAVITYGLPRDISPVDALLEEVRYTAGHVAWLRQRVAELEQDDLVWGKTETVDTQASEFTGVNTTEAAKPNMWLVMYRDERKHLVDVCKAAITCGIEERRVRLAESQGAELTAFLRRVFARLDLSTAQTALLAIVVPEELRRSAAMAGAN